MKRPYHVAIAEILAGAFLGDPWSQVGLTTRGRVVLGAHYAFLPALVRRTLRAFPEAPHARFDRLHRFLAKDGALRAAASATVHAGEGAVRVRGVLAAPVAMVPRVYEGAEALHARWKLPVLDAPGDVARWLGLSMPTLEWLADAKGLERSAGPRVQNYSYRWLPKKTGGARLLEAPKRRLKAVQRHILGELLNRVPPHEAAHGFVRGRDVTTHAAPHVGRAVVVRMDLEDFFLCISRARVSAMFRAFGYAAETAGVLAGLCTNGAPARGAPPPAPGADVARHIGATFRARQAYAAPHAPQGAPTSPALANLSAYGLDVRLTAAAKAAGAVYTRYADDLVFSGDEAFARRADSFVALVAAIAHGEGFAVNGKKTRVMPRSARQSVTGLVVNAKASVPRADFERLEAILYNAARHGPTSQNRDGHEDFRAHLRGRVAWVTRVDAARGAWLEELFSRIVWAG